MPGSRLSCGTARCRRPATLAELGADVATSVAEAARRAPIVVAMVTDSDAVVAAAHEQGMLAALAPGLIWAWKSTIGVAGIERVATLVLQERPDITLVDAPVSGSKHPAEHGTRRSRPRARRGGSPGTAQRTRQRPHRAAPRDLRRGVGTRPRRHLAGAAPCGSRGRRRRCRRRRLGGGVADGSGVALLVGRLLVLGSEPGLSAGADGPKCSARTDLPGGITRAGYAASGRAVTPSPRSAAPPVSCCLGQPCGILQQVDSPHRETGQDTETHRKDE